MTRLLLDTAVFVYAEGRPHPYREPCQEIVEMLTSGELAAEASVELVEEYCNVALRRRDDRARALRQATRIAALVELHDFERSDLPLTLELLGDHPALNARDAVFAATAVNRGVGSIVSPDRAFDEVTGLERVDPIDADRVVQAAEAGEAE